MFSVAKDNSPIETAKPFKTAEDLKNLKARFPNLIKLKTIKEAVVRRCFVENVFLKFSKKSQGNICARVFF